MTNKSLVRQTTVPPHVSSHCQVLTWHQSENIYRHFLHCGVKLCLIKTMRFGCHSAAVYTLSLSTAFSVQCIYWHEIRVHKLFNLDHDNRNSTNNTSALYNSSFVCVMIMCCRRKLAEQISTKKQSVFS